MVGMDGFCMNCGHDTTAELDFMYEDEDSSLALGFSEVDLEEEWDE